LEGAAAELEEEPEPEAEAEVEAEKADEAPAFGRSDRRKASSIFPLMK